MGSGHRSSLRAQPTYKVRRGIQDDAGDPVDVLGGTAVFTYDALEHTETETRAERKAQRERLARKKPLGFAPWDVD